MRQVEGRLNDKIREYCTKYNIYYLKTNGGGNPDCIMCINGKFIAFETKIGKNKTTDLQDYFIDKIIKNKGVALRIYTFEEAKQQIDYYRKES